MVMIADCGGDGDNAGCLLSLCHPKTGNDNYMLVGTCFVLNWIFYSYVAGNPTSYLLTNGVLQEIHWFKTAYGSWFLGDYVCEGDRQNCSLFSVTLMNSQKN